MATTGDSRGGQGAFMAWDHAICPITSVGNGHSTAAESILQNSCFVSPLKSSIHNGDSACENGHHPPRPDCTARRCAAWWSTTSCSLSNLRCASRIATTSVAGPSPAPPSFILTSLHAQRFEELTELVGYVLLLMMQRSMIGSNSGSLAGRSGTRNGRCPGLR
jgi:hypothetical protein